MTKVLSGRVLFCATAQAVHMELSAVEEWEFYDYAWDCKACGSVHCSECSYDSDGETITVYNCGRFPEGAK